MTGGQTASRLVCSVHSVVDVNDLSVPSRAGRPSVKYHDRMDSSATAEAPAATELRDRQDIPDRFKWDLTHIFADWTAWQAAYDELEAKIGQFAALAGHARRRCRSAARRASAARRYRSARVQGLVFRVALVRPGSARQPDQREAPAGADSVRQGRAGRRLVRPGAADDPARRRSRAWIAQRRRTWRSTASRSKTSTVSRSTCSTTRASVCSRSRAASSRRRTTPTRRCPPPTPGFPRSCRTARRSR